MHREEIDLHGMRVDEAIQAVEQFLEKSYLAGHSKVWVIHGKGTGTLRLEVERLLKRYVKNKQYVKAFTIADSSHGADGAKQVDIL